MNAISRPQVEQLASLTASPSSGVWMQSREEKIWFGDPGRLCGQSWLKYLLQLTLLFSSVCRVTPALEVTSEELAPIRFRLRTQTCANTTLIRFISIVVDEHFLLAHCAAAAGQVWRRWYCVGHHNCGLRVAQSRSLGAQRRFQPGG